MENEIRVDQSQVPGRRYFLKDISHISGDFAMFVKL